MSMGHVDSALYFQSQVVGSLQELVGENCAVWIDDVLFYARTVEEYLSALGRMLDLLEDKGF